MPAREAPTRWLPTLSWAAGACAAFVLLVLVLFAELVAEGGSYLTADDLTPRAVTRGLVGTQEPGQASLWVPHLFAGMPGPGSLLHVPDAYLPERVAYGFGLRWPVFLALHLSLAALGAFLLARRLGASGGAALLAGFGFGFAPYLVALVVHGHGSQVLSAAYLPFVWLCADRLITRRDLLGVGLAGLAIGLLLQGRHMQVVYYGLALFGALGALGVARLAATDRPREAARAGAGLAAALVVGGLLAAKVALPVWDYRPYSTRGAPSVLATEPAGNVGLAYATDWSLPPAEALTYLLPSLHGFGGATYTGGMPFTDYPNYVGLLTLLLALVAVVFRAPRAGVPLLVGGASLLVAFGRHTPVYGLAYAWLPFFDAFRVPSMALLLSNLALALLAAMGLDALVQRAASLPDLVRRRAAWAAALGVPAVALLGLLAPSLVPADGFEPAHRAMLAGDLFQVGLQLGVALAALALLFRGRLRAGAFGGIVAVLVAVDLLLVGGVVVGNTPRGRAAEHFEPDAVVRALAGETEGGRFRIFPVDAYFGETRWAAAGLESIGGYHAAKPRAYQDLLDRSGLPRFLDKYYERDAAGRARPRRPDAVPEPERSIHLRLLDLLNVKYLLSPAPIPDRALVHRRRVRVAGDRTLEIYENPNALPRPYLVGAYEVVADPRLALERLLAPGFDARRSVLLDRPPGVAPTPDFEATVRVEEAASDRLVVTTQSRTPQLLVLADNHYPPGWQASVDGEPAEILRADFAFRAVAVPAGQHRVEMTTRRDRYQLGTRLSQAGLALATLLIVAGGARAWRRQGTHDA